MMIKGVVCDLDGVYFVHGKENFIKNVVEHYDVKEKDVRTVFFSSDAMMHYKQGKINDEQYWTEFAQHLKIDVAPKYLMSLLVENYEVDTRIENLVKALKNNGYKTIVCSNNFPARVNGLEDRFHFMQNFDVKIFSYEVGVLKPDQKIFDEIGKRSGLANEEILMIDDGVDKIGKAKAFGFVALWYENYLKLMEALEENGVKV